MLNIDFRQLFSDQARQLIFEGTFGQPEHLSVDELHQQLIEEIDWETRMQWHDEYVAIIRDAIGLYRMAQTVGDPRFVIQQVLQRMNQLPEWLGHRAFRFAVLVKRNHWETEGFVSPRADVVVLTAKLAAAFIDIVSRTLGIVKERDLSFSSRLTDLVKAPDVNGIFSCALDSVKKCSTAFPFDKVGINLEINEQGKRVAIDLSRALKSMSKNSTFPSSYEIASPLCGWGSEVKAPSGITVWKDPRECCLCHICGDDDSGIYNDPPVTYLSGLGRLLPMADGYWIHTACALWSSEVWEAADDGLIHAVEKARARGAQLKCFGCGFPGATVGCNKGNCPFNFHLPCARACGAVFTSSQQVFCSSHLSCAVETVAIENSEPMKTLMIAPDKKSVTDKDISDGAETDLFTRVGTLLVHSLGSIEVGVDGFHSESYITPPGFVSSRIFWSALYPRRRTVYILKIERNAGGQPEFVIIPGDSPTSRIIGSSASLAYNTLVEKVRKVNACYFSQGDMCSKLPVTRRTRRKAYGLNGPQVRLFVLIS
jgi:F/Y-rich N-terminus/PHD-like zinc-binding domain